MTRFQGVRAVFLGLLIVSLVVERLTQPPSASGNTGAGINILLLCTMSLQLLVEISLYRAGRPLPWANPVVDRRLAIAFTILLVVVGGLIGWAVWYAPTERVSRMTAMATFLLFIGILPFVFAWGMSVRKKP